MARASAVAAEAALVEEAEWTAFSAAAISASVLSLATWAACFIVARGR